MHRILSSRRLPALLAAGVSAVCFTAADAADLYKGGLKDAPAVWVSNDIIASNNQVGVAFATTRFDYLETDDNGVKLDSEGNWVPGVNASLSVMQNWLVSNFYFRADYTYLNGKTDYVGSYWGGTYGDLTQKDPAIVNDFDFRIGKGFELQRNFMATPYVGVGYHDWQRDVGYKEEYTHGYVGAGLMLQWSPVNRFVLSANGLVGSTFDSHIKTWDGDYPIDVGLGNSTTYRVGLSGDYALTQNIHVNAGVEWVEFKYGKSETTYFGELGVLEPDSRTQNTTVKVGLGYAFGSGSEPLK